MKASAAIKLAGLIFVGRVHRAADSDQHIYAS